jgi:sodium/hydrogen exchanger family protein
MSTASFNGLLIISVIAVVAPVLAASVKALKLPGAVVEIVAGIIVGPSLLDWVKVDQPVTVVALLGLAFLLFLAGLEIGLRAVTPGQLRAPLTGYAGSLLLGSVTGLALHAAGWVRNPLFLAITLSATSLGLVVPVLTDAGQSRTVFGQLTIGGAIAGEFGAITSYSRCCTRSRTAGGPARRYGPASSTGPATPRRPGRHPAPPPARPGVSLHRAPPAPWTLAPASRLPPAPAATGSPTSATPGTSGPPPGPRPRPRSAPPRPAAPAHGGPVLQRSARRHRGTSSFWHSAPTVAG